MKDQPIMFSIEDFKNVSADQCQASTSTISKPPTEPSVLAASSVEDEKQQKSESTSEGKSSSSELARDSSMLKDEDTQRTDEGQTSKESITSNAEALKNAEQKDITSSDKLPVADQTEKPVTKEPEPKV